MENPSSHEPFTGPYPFSLNWGDDLRRVLPCYRERSIVSPSLLLRRRYVCFRRIANPFPLPAGSESCRSKLCPSEVPASDLDPIFNPVSGAPRCGPHHSLSVFTVRTNLSLSPRCHSFFWNHMLLVNLRVCHIRSTTLPFLNTGNVQFFFLPLDQSIYRSFSIALGGFPLTFTVRLVKSMLPPSEPDRRQCLPLPAPQMGPLMRTRPAPSPLSRCFFSYGFPSYSRELYDCTRLWDLPPISHVSSPFIFFKWGFLFFFFRLSRPFLILNEVPMWS